MKAIHHLPSEENSENEPKEGKRRARAEREQKENKKRLYSWVRAKTNNKIM